VLLVVLLVLVLIVGSAIAYVRFWAPRQSFPQTSGTIELPGLDAPVEVVRDDYGVAHVTADTTEDLFFAQGYVNAQDRFFEMDFRRHVTSGRISEMVGESQLETDAFLRTMQWREIAEQEYAALSPTAKTIVDSYAEGVNAWLADHQGTDASLEYLVIGLISRGYEIEPWDPVDSLAWMKALAYDLLDNIDSEALRSQLSATLSREQIAELYPPWPYERHATVQRAAGVSDPTAGAALAPLPGGDEVRPAPGYVLPGGVLERPDEAPTPTPAAEATTDTQAAGLRPSFLGDHGAELGSNNWVLGPEQTATGRPLVANDPHLGPALPSLWSQVGLRCRTTGPECPYELTGFTLAGVPGIIIGHNGTAAWAVTNTGADTSDLVLEQVEGDDYFVDGERRPLQQKTEVLRYPGGEQTILVRATEHGPLVSDLPDTGYPEVGRTAPVPPGSPPRGDGYAVALNWTALRPGTLFEALTDMWVADDWGAFRAAAAEFDALPQNLVLGIDGGDIAFQLPGNIPVREGYDGNWPVPGWDSTYRWVGYIPHDAMPSIYNPPNRRVVTANQVLVQPGYPYKIGEGYNYGYRSQRIVDLLEQATGQGPISLADSEAIQADTLMPFAETLVPALLDVPDPPAQASEAIDLLREWDGLQPEDAAAPVYFNAVWSVLLDLIFGDELTGDTAPNSGDRWFEVVRNLLADPTNQWWDDEATPDVETRDDILRRALQDGYDLAVQEQGDDVSAWRWGEVHTLDLVATPLGESGIAPIEALFNRGPVPTAGGYQSVAVASFIPGEGFGVDWTASMRMHADVGSWDDSTWVNLTGASGHAFNPHYTDQVESWRTFESLPWPASPQAIEAAGEQVLTLIPAS
jgi:penicillin amidase